MNIAIAQLYTPNYDSWAPIVIDNTATYCNKHGYKFYHKRIEYPQDRHPAWYRIPFIIELFRNEEVDWIFWSDIDSLIMNHSISIESFLKEDKNLVMASQGRGLYCGKDCGEPVCVYCQAAKDCGHILNTGQFFIKNTKWSAELLDLWWKWPEAHTKYLWDAWWDNDAMNFFWKNNLLSFDENVYIEYYTRRFNSFYHCQSIDTLGYFDGDFLCHFTGNLGSKTREGLVESYARSIKT